MSKLDSLIDKMAKGVLTSSVARRLTKQYLAIAERDERLSSYRRLSETGISLSTLRGIGITPLEEMQLGFRPTKCAKCKHFSLSEGQALMGAKPSWQTVSAVLSPAQMAASERDDIDDLGPIEEQVTEPAAVESNNWGDYGVCYVHQELRNQHTSCNQWEVPDVE